MIKVDNRVNTVPVELTEDNKSANGELARVIDHVENKGMELKDFSFSVYKNSNVKKQLEIIFFRKCAYCESKFKSTSHGHIEHWRPKAGVSENPNHLGYYWLASNWDNLLYSCQVCNISHKKNFFPLENPHEYSLKSADAIEKEKPLLVNPYTDNPDEHFTYELKGGVSSLTSKGAVSIEKYGLTREDLVMDRNTATETLIRNIDSILFYIDLLSVQLESSLLEKLASEIETHFEYINSAINPKSEFSKMHKDILKSQMKKYEENKVFLSLANHKIIF